MDDGTRPFPAPIRMRNGDLMIPVYDLNTGAAYGPWPCTWDGSSRRLTLYSMWRVE